MRFFRNSESYGGLHIILILTLKEEEEEEGLSVKIRIVCKPPYESLLRNNLIFAFNSSHRFIDVFVVVMMLVQFSFAASQYDFYMRQFRNAPAQ
jgi:hypothetical protein